MSQQVNALHVLPLGDTLRDFLLSEGHSLMLLGEKLLFLLRRWSVDTHTQTKASRAVSKKRPKWRLRFLLCIYLHTCWLLRRVWVKRSHKEKKGMSGEWNRASEVSNGLLEMCLFCQRRGGPAPPWMTDLPSSFTCVRLCLFKGGRIALSLCVSSDVSFNQSVLKCYQCSSSLSFPDVATKVWLNWQEPLSCLRNSFKSTLCLYHVFIFSFGTSTTATPFSCFSSNE